MSDEIILVANGENMYGVPIEVCEKYTLSGDQLDSVYRRILANRDSDVEGQSSQAIEEPSYRPEDREYIMKRNEEYSKWINGK